ncbi:MAG TPA: 16S rRNA (cytidine(1402)-2'-O)-methyltransferase [Blastocatellia bacterium]|nr:16S rRNA (cytidine(1402)-2'-O)-methyltransferase [Blastocatellia bacterium]
MRHGWRPFAALVARMPGTLFLVATPIGNLEDITFRALRVLREVDLIACEDTRHARKLLSHFDISKPLTSYHEHNERERTEELIQKLEAGTNIALTSDAGMPLISDPGYRVVCEASLRGIKVVPIPGASAVITALAASGLPTDEFVFAGFLPRKQGARRARFNDFLLSPSTLVFYETPHRIKEALADAREVLGDRPAAIARELTKIHEEVLRGKISQLEAHFAERVPRGEFVMVIGPASEGSASKEASEIGSILDAVDEIMEAEGLDQKAALKLVAGARGITRRAAYKQMVDEIEHRRANEPNERTDRTGLE